MGGTVGGGWGGLGAGRGAEGSRAVFLHLHHSDENERERERESSMSSLCLKENVCLDEGELFCLQYYENEREGHWEQHI